MNLPIPLVVALTLLRELLRALAFPLHCVLYLFGRERAEQRTRELLSHWQSAQPSQALAEFLRNHRPAGKPQPHLFISAGEASGEAHAARLLATLREHAHDHVRVSAFGGQDLRHQGADVLVSLSEHAIMGVGGVLKALPLVLRTFARFLRLLRQDRPDVILLVDYPGLHLVMGRAARRYGVPVIHYVAPQYWAWAPWRMARYRRCVDLSLSILPFEVAFFRGSGVPCEYVGHPLLDRLVADPPAQARVAQLRADPTLCLMPGSRRAEIEAHLPGMLKVARTLLAHDPQARVVIAHRDPRRVAHIQTIVAREGASFAHFDLGELGEKLASAQLVLAKSGTGSLEATLMGTPTVVVYRLPNAFMSFVYRHFLTVPWFAAANLIAARAVVPERCFHRDDGWDWATAEVLRLWPLAEPRLRCIDQLADVRYRLGDPGASERVAYILLHALGILETDAA